MDENNTYDERMKRFLHFWNMKNATEEMIEIAHGEIRIIIETLADYYDVVQDKIKSMDSHQSCLWGERANRIKKIQTKLEESIGYNRDEQLEKCKNKKKKNDDIGGDALELAFKKSVKEEK